MLKNEPGSGVAFDSAAMKLDKPEIIRPDALDFLSVDPVASVPQSPLSSPNLSSSEVATEPKKNVVCVQDSPFRSKRSVVFFHYPNRIVAQERVGHNTPLENRGGKEVLRFKISEDVWRYNCVVRAFVRNGFQETHHKRHWNLFWGHQLSPPMFQGLQWFQRVNHFPGTGGLGNKALLARNIHQLRRERREFDFSFFPETFLWPQDRSLLTVRLQDDLTACHSGGKHRKEPIWILKPPSSSCGRGIKLATASKCLSLLPEKRKMLVSRYVDDPFLIHQRKSDLRLYVLVTSFDPLMVYLFDDGLVRFATHKYSTTKGSLKSNFTHLTNYSINKKSKHYVKNVQRGPSPAPEETTLDSDHLQYSKWSFITFKQWLRNENYDVEGMMRRIHDLIIKTLVSVEAVVSFDMTRLGLRRSSCFEIFGFDVLLDASLKPFLLEVNRAPSLSSSAPLDKFLKTKLMADTFHLIGVRPVDARRFFKRIERDKKRSRGTKLASTSSMTDGRTSAHRQKYPLRKRPQSGPAPRQKHTSRLTEATVEGGTLDEEGVQLLLQFEEEGLRAKEGGFSRIFPTARNFPVYQRLFTSKRAGATLLSQWLQLSRSARHSLLVSACAGETVTLQPKARKTRSAPRHVKRKKKKKNFSFLAKRHVVEEKEIEEEEEEEDDEEEEFEEFRSATVPAVVSSEAFESLRRRVASLHTSRPHTRQSAPSSFRAVNSHAERRHNPGAALSIQPVPPSHVDGFQRNASLGASFKPVPRFDRSTSEGMQCERLRSAALAAADSTSVRRPSTTRVSLDRLQALLRSKECSQRAYVRVLAENSNARSQRMPTLPTTRRRPLSAPRPLERLSQRRRRTLNRQ